MKTNTIIFLIIALLIATTGCTTDTVLKDKLQSSSITTIGQSELNIMPDKASITIRIETQNKNAQKAQQENKEITNKVIKELRKAGVREKDIETQNYRIDPIMEWDPTTRKSIEKGYRATNTFVVETTELEKVGKLIDTAVNAGANRIDSIYFELSKEKQQEAKKEALKLAAENAKEKAQAIADGSGVRLGKIIRISEQGFDYYPLRAMATGAAETTTPIIPQKIKVNARIEVEFEI
ncbi:hypothetical protein B6U93_00225 [Candidatus Woesearchaeota archaeon ex4484_78]|nr:MAG: hypothetical protein B6U93_00225 [Candidatus Woesearchaeota archaeon ex4484_78]